MPQISVTVITFNEERNIGRCLQSVIDIADDIVVLDSGSTDNTIAICKTFNVRVEIAPWQNYSHARNVAASYAKHDWILALDADEALSDELKISIEAFKQNNQPTFASFNRLTNYCGKWIKHCGWYPDVKIRVYDKTKATYEGIIHEHLNWLPDHVQKLKGNLLHYSYYTVFEHIQQANKFTNLTAKAAYDRGDKSNMIYVVFAPLLKFIKSYFLQLGFLDGYYGFLVCIISAHATFYKYVKLHLLLKQGK
ncbi:MAG: glycosyltransferase family 2 protein [Bacteroidia bacterium]|nr:glycosyltransferase family 2 protein [Bacteroidia bacterium]HQV00952.1 glycosyltransferase family 2 protein [Bacteroidia bacterium]